MGEKDIVSKQIVRRLAVDLATYLLKLDIDADSLERRRLAKSLLGLLPDPVIAEKTGLPIEAIRRLHSNDA
jgi:hypothetical protein